RSNCYNLVTVQYIAGRTGVNTADGMNSKAVAAKSQRNGTVEAVEPVTERPQNDVKVSVLTLKSITLILFALNQFIRMILTLAVVFYAFRTPNIILELMITSKPLLDIFTPFKESTYFIKPFIFLAVNSNFQN